MTHRISSLAYCSTARNRAVSNFLPSLSSFLNTHLYVIRLWSSKNIKILMQM